MWNPAKSLGAPAYGQDPLHNLVAMLARQRGIAFASFALVFGGAILFGLLLSDRYESHMQILVEQSQLRRAEPVATGGSNDQTIVNQQAAGDQTLNSEIAILTSNDVMRQVVAVCGLDAHPGLKEKMLDGMWNLAGNLHATGLMRGLSGVLPVLRLSTPEERTARAVERLSAKLRVSVIKMSDVIAVSYTSNDPALAAKVLRTLSDVYLQQHASAHHPQGELQFFQKETGEARTLLDLAEERLVNFTQQGGVASGQVQLDGALRRLNEVQAMRSDLRTSVAGVTRRIAALQQEMDQTPSRQTTQLKTSDNGQLLEQLKSSLLNLRLKRTELTTKYQPTYPLVVEVDKQIEQAQAALIDAERSQVQETTTDRDPDFELAREDLTRSRTELANLNARAGSLAIEDSLYQNEVRRLQQQEVSQEDLLRTAKAAEDNYLLLLHKQEEARISEELDRRRIFNVSLVESASIPVLPVHSAFWYLARGAMLGLVFAFGAAAAADKLDPTVRTPYEAEAALRGPVLATLSLPARSAEYVIDDGSRSLLLSKERIFRSL
jgi:uncharacterized protein involved in exopolysaccharide biosynthesis